MASKQVIGFIIGGAIMLSLFTSAVHAQTAQSSANGGAMDTRPMVIKLSESAQKRMAAAMHSGHDYCYLEDLNPGDDSSMTLICGVAPTKSTFSP